MSYNINYFKNYGTDNRYYWESTTKDLATHFNHSLLVYGDYCNTGAVGKANVQTILDDAELCERVGVIELNEHYNTTSLMFPIAALQDAELCELLESLDNYPVLDERLMCEIENDMRNEAWESYGRRGFDMHLQSLGYDTYELSSDDLDELFDKIRQATNYEMGHVDGDSWYFDFKSMGGIGNEVLSEILKILECLKGTSTLRLK